MRAGPLRRPFTRARRTLLSRLGLFGEKARQPAPHRVSLFRSPFAITLASFHAKLAGLDLVAQERVRPCRAVEIAIQHFGDMS